MYEFTLLKSMFFELDKYKIEQLKSQFASQIEALNVDEILKNRSENQEE